MGDYPSVLAAGLNTQQSQLKEGKVCFGLHERSTVECLSLWQWQCVAGTVHMVRNRKRETDPEGGTGNTFKGPPLVALPPLGLTLQRLP